MIRSLLWPMIMSLVMTWGFLRLHDGGWRMVWHAECIDHVEKSPDMEMVAPLRSDGTPDMARAVVLHTVVVYKVRCGRIEKVKEE